ncbi:MAG TPA: beta-ketoacyl-ACP synthase 3 [Solirubrobacterales bacterium]|nr:beta-ketoacyl-ACP synthase 3 [Solirubrobacterales bacterium]
MSEAVAVNGRERPVVAVPPREQPTRGAAVASVAAAVPERVLANGPIADRLGVTERWIVSRTGVRERRVAAPGETLADYAAEAGSRALEEAPIDPGDVDLVLVATMSHERLSPIAAAPVAAALGANRAGAMDINAACSGFVSALGLAAGLIEAGRMQNVLVVGADLLSRLTDTCDRKTAALFGDAAGAVVLSATAPGAGRIGPVVLGADGARAELITCERDEALIRMNGHDTFRHAVDRLAEATLAACEAAETELSHIDLFAYHQANARILAAVGERLGLDANRVLNCIGRYGNTSAASVPLALAEARAEGLLPDGARVLLGAFGAGLTWGATVIEWGGGHA